MTRSSRRTARRAEVWFHILWPTAQRRDQSYPRSPDSALWAVTFPRVPVARERSRRESERREREARAPPARIVAFTLSGSYTFSALGTDTNPIQHTHTHTDEPQEGVRVQATLLLSTSRSSHSHITRSCATGRLDCPCALVRENLRHRAGTSARLRHHRRATCQVEVCTRSRPPPCKSVASPPASGEPQRASSPCSRTGAGTRRRA